MTQIEEPTIKEPTIEEPTQRATTSEKKNGGCPFDHENMTQADYERLPLPPGSDGLPFVGETPRFIADPAGFASMITQLGDVAYADVLGAKTIFARGTDYNRWLFKGENDYLQNQWSRPTATLLGDDSVSMLVGEAHRQRRKLLNPHFLYDRMDAFIPVIQETLERHLAQWADSDHVTLSMATRAMTFEIIARYIFGDITPLPVDKLRDDFRIWTGGIISLGINLPFTRFGKALQARKRLWKTLTDAIEHYRQQDDMGECVLKSLFDIRDENDQPLPTATIVDEIQVLLFAGHDTTVSALTNMFILLAQHPHVIDKGREEAQSLTDDDLNNAKRLRQLPYIDAIINETLRYHAPVTGAFRQMNQDRCYAGYRIPKGWALSLPISGTHHNTDLWDDPETFDPERFLRNEHKRENLMFIPFGGGPRMCLGMNFALVTMRLVLARAFQSYRWYLLPDQNLEMRILPTPLPKDGGLARFKRL